MWHVACTPLLADCRKRAPLSRDPRSAIWGVMYMKDNSQHQGIPSRKESSLPEIDYHGSWSGRTLGCGIRAGVHIKPQQTRDQQRFANSAEMVPKSTGPFSFFPRLSSLIEVKSRLCPITGCERRVNHVNQREPGETSFWEPQHH